MTSFTRCTLFFLGLLAVSCKTTDQSQLLEDRKKLPTMSAEEYDVSVDLSKNAAEQNVFRSLMVIDNVKQRNPALANMDQVLVNEEVITFEEIPTEEEYVEGAESLKQVGGSALDQAKASLEAYFQDPQNKAVVTGAAVGALSALAWNQVSQRSGSYYRALILAMNKWTSNSAKSFAASRAGQSIKRGIESTTSTKVTFKYSKKFYESLSKSIGVTGFKPASLALTSSAISSSLAVWWMHSDYIENHEDIAVSKERFQERLGPQRPQVETKDEIMEIAKRYAWLLVWDEAKIDAFYKAAVSDIIARIPEIAKQNGGKIHADTIIPFDALLVIERINAREQQRHPQGYLTSPAHIAHLRHLLQLINNAPDQEDEYQQMTDKDRNILNFIDNLDAIVASNFVMENMANHPNVKPDEKARLQKMIAENKDLLVWISRNFD